MWTAYLESKILQQISDFEAADGQKDINVRFSKYPGFQNDHWSKISMFTGIDRKKTRNIN